MTGTPVRLGALLALATAVTSCVEEDSGHRFATDPFPTAAVATPSPFPTLAARTALPGATPVSPSTLLVARGAADRFYFRVGRELWTMGAAGDDPRPVLSPPPGTEIRAVTASPSGDRAAALLTVQQAGRERADVVVLDASGKELRRHSGIAALLGSGAGAAAMPRSLNWSPQGDQLLVAFAPGGLIRAPAGPEGEPTVLVGAEQAKEPAGAAWSPTGEDIAFLASVDPNQPANLFLAGVSATPTPPRALLAAPTPGRAITEFAWVPDGRAIVFAEGAVPGGGATGGDLWHISLDGSDRRLIASAGSAAPVGQVAGVVASPDGRAVAHSVVVPEEEGARFHSLWVRDLANGRGFRVPVPPEQAVTDVWWTELGLVFRVVPAGSFSAGVGGGPFALYRVSDGTAPVRIYYAEPPVAATPVAEGSPVASPPVVSSTG